MSEQSEDRSFSWVTSKESVAIPRVDAIAVYTNPENDVVIRQQDSMDYDDAVIVIPRDRVNDLIAVLKRELEG